MKVMICDDCVCSTWCLISEVGRCFVSLLTFKPNINLFESPEDKASHVFDQVLESAMKKKLAHAQEVYNQAKHSLTYFSFQKQRLEDLMSQMADRLKAVEGSLSDLTEATSPEDIATVKVWPYHSFNVLLSTKIQHLNL